MTNQQLNLPEPYVSFGPDKHLIYLPAGDYYTADQMRKHAERVWQAATAAERERAAKVCEEFPEGSSYRIRPKLAAAIRAG
jgi:hypothetical protein